MRTAPHFQCSDLARVLLPDGSTILTTYKGAVLLVKNMSSGMDPAFIGAIVAIAISLVGSTVFLVWSRRRMPVGARIVFSLVGPVGLYFLAINLENLPPFVSNGSRDASLIMLLGIVLGLMPFIVTRAWIRVRQTQRE